MADIDFGKSYFQFTQLDEEFEPRIASVFNQTVGLNISIKPKLNLREVILLDIQLAIDIFRNQALVENTTQSKAKMRLKSNRGMMAVSHQAMVNGYHNSVWNSENNITNIIALRNLRLHYLVTYRSNEIIFILHR